ncbi:hypothetical protein WJX79_008699 [Trebouxia sp. C0005]
MRRPSLDVRLEGGQHTVYTAYMANSWPHHVASTQGNNSTRLCVTWKWSASHSAPLMLEVIACGKTSSQTCTG